MIVQTTCTYLSSKTVTWPQTESTGPLASASPAAPGIVILKQFDFVCKPLKLVNAKFSQVTI